MTAYSTCDVGSLVAKARRPLRLFAPVCLMASLAAMPAIGAPTAPIPSISEDQVMRIVAASPLRELNRAWSQCIDEALFIAGINSMADIAKIEGLVGFSCEAYESRLTGELVKRQGYQRGNAIMAALKRKNRARYEAASRTVAAKPKGFVSQIGEWTIFRISNGACSAKVSNNALIEPVSSILIVEHGQWRLGFLKAISHANNYLGRRGQSEAVQLTAVSDDGIIGSRDQQVRTEVGDGFIGWTMPMDDSLARELARASRVQFRALSDEQNFDRVFPITGIADAWIAVKKCNAK